MEDKTEKILIFRTEHIGDYALSLPFIKTIRENYPSAKIDLVIGPWNKEFAEATPYVDNIILWDNPFVKRHIGIFEFFKPSNVKNVLSFFKGIRKEKYDMVLAFSNRKFIKILVKFFKARTKIAGFDYLPDESEIERFNRMIRSLGMTKNETPIELKLENTEKIEVDALFKNESEKRIIIHPITPLNEKNWDLANWAKLMNLLDESSKDDLFLIIGSESDRSKIDTLISNIKNKNNALNLAGQLTISQTVRLISKSNLMIGSDSGPIHFAELTNTPILAIFGPTDEKRWGPHRSIDKIIKKEKINEIGVEEVFNLIK